MPEFPESRVAVDIGSDMRGTLRNFGLKVGVVSMIGYEARIRHLVEVFPRLAAIPVSTRITTKAADQLLRRGVECLDKLKPSYFLNAYEISGPLRPRPNFQLTPSARMMPDAALPS